MKISKDELNKLAELSRLKIDEKDFSRFEKNINDIVEYVGILQQVKVPEELKDEMAVVSEEVLASDQKDAFALQNWRQNVPRINEDYIEVEAVFDEQK